MRPTLVRSLVLAPALVLAGIALPGCPGGDAEPEREQTPVENPMNDLMQSTGVAGMRELGTISAAGSTLAIVAGPGLGTPGERVSIDLTVTGGLNPAVVRLWVGDEAGTDALKSKADSHGDHLHGSVDMPSSLTPDMALWLEVEASDGTREAKSVSIG